MIPCGAQGFSLHSCYEGAMQIMYNRGNKWEPWYKWTSRYLRDKIKILGLGLLQDSVYIYYSFLFDILSRSDLDDLREHLSRLTV